MKQMMQKNKTLMLVLEANKASIFESDCIHRCNQDSKVLVSEMFVTYSNLAIGLVLTIKNQIWPLCTLKLAPRGLAE